jgi:hypothetical protein
MNRQHVLSTMISVFRYDPKLVPTDIVQELIDNKLLSQEYVNSRIQKDIPDLDYFYTGELSQ